MTPQNVKDFFQLITGDVFSEENFLIFLNTINQEILRQRPWVFKEYKQAYTTSQSAQALPTNCEGITRVASSDGLITYEKIDFNQQSDVCAYSFWIDEVAQTITFGSAGASVNVFYTTQPTDLTMASTFPIPTQFQDAYKYGVIRDYFIGDDDDETNLRKGEFYGNKFNDVMRSLVDYDARHQVSNESVEPSDDYLISNGIIP